LEISRGRDRILEDISATRGTPWVSGMKGNSTPATAKKKVTMKEVNSIKLSFLITENIKSHPHSSA
jgi:hypothetical protein